MFEQVIYKLVDPASPDVVRYIGRTNATGERQRFHAFNAHSQDCSPRGLWVAYLWYAGRSPELVPVERESFADKTEAEGWAKDRERHWIRHFAEAGEPLVNQECWWSHPHRKPIPAGYRMAWEKVHLSLFWFDFVARNVGETLAAIDSKLGRLSLTQPTPAGEKIRSLLSASEAERGHQRGRHCLVDSVRGLAREYPSIAVAPLEWIEQSRPAAQEDGSWELRVGS